MNFSAILATAQWTPTWYWQLRNELPHDIGNCAMMPVAMLRSAQIAALQRGWIFIPGMVICFQIANSCTRWRRNFKGLSQHGGQAIFSINICASLLITTYWMNLISALSISLDRTFKRSERWSWRLLCLKKFVCWILYINSNQTIAKIIIYPSHCTI